MKKAALYLVAVALTAVLFGVASLNVQHVQATGMTEGSYPAPLAKPDLQKPLLAGEGSYPTPACSPQNPKCGGTGNTTIAGEGSYPTPACSPSNPKCKPPVQTIAGEGSYPTPACSPQNPKCGGTGSTTNQTIAGEGSYPTPACSPSNPKCKPPVQTIAGEGSYPTPACSPQNPKCGGTGNTTIALLGDGAAPMPLYVPGGMQ